MKKKILSFIFALLTLGLGLSNVNAAVTVDSICFGDTITIGAVHGNGATYLWNTGAIMVPQITVSPLITTIYIQHWDDTLYHQIPVHDTFLVVVSPRPNTLTIDSIFVGQSRTIGTLRSYANGYDWNTGATSAQITVSPLFTTTYFVRWQNAVTADIATDTFKIVVNNPPATSTTIDSLCKGTSTTIGYPYTNGVWYLWSTGQTTPTISVFVQYTTTYVVSVLNSSMTVIQQDTFKIVVKNNPNVWVTGPTLPICTGSNVTLIAHGAVNYHWFVGPNSDTLNIFGLTTSAQFIVVGTGSNGCSDTMTYPITVQSPPTVYSIVGDNSYCANQQGVVIGLSGSESNCWYKLYKNGMGVANVNGTGSPINFGLHPAGTYTVRGFNNNVYCDAPMNGTLNVTVKPLPGFIGYIIGDTIVCEGETKSYLVSYSSYVTSFIWLVPNGATIVSGQGTGHAIIYWGNSIGGTVSVIGVNACGTGQARIFNVFVKPKPNVWIIGDNVLCYGDSLQLTANPSNLSFAWNNGMTTPSISGLATSNAFYSVIGTDSNGCSDTSNVSLIVQNLPMAYTITGDSTYCANQQGSGIGLNGSEANAAYYLFNQGVNVGYLFGTGFPISFGPQPAGTYTISASYNSVGCQNDMNGTLNVTVKPLPGNINFSIPISSPCEGQSVTYGSAVSTNATSYVWSAPNGATITGGQGTANCTINWGNSVGGQVSVMGVNACGIGQAMTFTVVVVPKPTLSLSATTSSLCSGESTTLTAISNVPSYLWSTGATTSSISVTPSVGTYTYTMQVTGTNGCSNSGSIDITVNPKPTLATGASATTICNGESVTLSAISNAVSYAWSNGVTTPSFTTIPINTGSIPLTISHSVIVTGANGCTNNGFISFDIHPSPAISLTANPNTICAGGSSILTANGTNTYVWSNGLGTGATKTVSPLIATTYSVMGIDTNGCVDTASTTITINPSPTVSITASQNPVCAGSLSTLTAVGAANYIWNTGSIGSQSIVSPSTTTTYSVVGTNTNGCTNTASITVTVKPPLQLTFNSAGMVTCPGGNNGFANVSVTGGNYPYNYLWNPTPGNGQGNNAVNGLHAGIYVVSVTDANGCVGMNSVTITEPQPISILSVINEQTVSVSVTGGTLLPGDNYQYNWLPTPQSGQGTANATFGPGTDSVILTVLDGHYCQKSKVIYIHSTGINELDEKSISIYPNPAKDILHINSAEKFQYIEIYSIVGKSVLKIKEANEVDITSLASGSYIMSLIDASGNARRAKFIKE
jgi:hypothetical protein